MVLKLLDSGVTVTAVLGVLSVFSIASVIGLIVAFFMLIACFAVLHGLAMWAAEAILGLVEEFFVLFGMGKRNWWNPAWSTNRFELFPMHGRVAWSTYATITLAEAAVLLMVVVRAVHLVNSLPPQ